MSLVVHPSLLRSCRRRLPRIIHSSDCFSCPPAAGYRSNASGALTNVGTEGLYWSSSSYAAGNINAGNLNFNSGNVNPLNGNNRANGFSVRCVQHLRGAVFYLLQLRVPTFGILQKTASCNPEWRGPRLPPAR